MNIRPNLRSKLISACVFGATACAVVVAGPLPLTEVNIAGGEFWWALKPKGEIHPFKNLQVEAVFDKALQTSNR